MKKLSCSTLLGLILSSACIAQSIISIRGDADVIAIRNQVNRSLDYLNIQEALHIDICFTENIPEKLKGLTLAVPATDDTTSTLQFYRIRIDARLDDVNRLSVLAHEMMHIRQYVKGDLKITKSHEIIWKGKKYPFKHLNHRKNPWELEAYRHDQYLAKVLQESPVEVPRLVASEVKN